MSITTSEAFGLFLTSLRNEGVDIPLCDAACAEMIAGALQDRVGDYGTKEVDTAAENIALELECLCEAGLLATDNGSIG